MKKNELAVLYRQWQGVATYKIMGLHKYDFAKVRIHDLHNEADDSLGYTRKGTAYKRKRFTVDIYVNSKHKIAKGLSEEARITMVKGVVFHEILHQLLSDFTILDKISQVSPRFKGEILASINNIIEDAFIERFAFLFFGEDVIRAIHFVQALAYKNSKRLEEIEGDLNQYITALIQYKLFGPIKGTFTNPLTEEVFANSLEPLDEGVKNRNPTFRFEAAQQLLEISKPLWEDQANISEMLEKLIKELMKMGMTMEGDGSGTGTPMYIPSDDEDSEADEKEQESSKSKCQERTRQKMSKSKASGSSDKSDDKTAEDGSGNTDSSDTSSSSKSDSDSEGKLTDGKDSSSDTKGDIENDEASLTEKDVENIRREMDRAKDIAKKEEAESAAMKAEKDAMSKEASTMSSTAFTKMTNTRIIPPTTCKDDLEDEYREIMSPYKPIIKKIAEGFRRIFADSEAEDYEYRRSGKTIDLIRAHKNTTPYIFRKRIEPTHVGDTSLMLLVDESGSMRWNHRYEIARAATIVIAEVCKAVKMPFGCIGFTADECGSRTIQHNVYCNFRNSNTEMYNLSNIQPRYNNQDGESIRFAGSMLAKQHTINKILIVISDGMPACDAYGRKNGIDDTKAAVEEARRKGLTVIGVAIDHPDAENYIYMYGKDFVPCDDLNTLPSTLCRVLQKEINKRR